MSVIKSYLQRILGLREYDEVSKFPGDVPDGRGGYTKRTSEPVPPAGDMRAHHYGDVYKDGELVDRNTIHGTGTIDIRVDSEGKITSVWYRCLNLPFTTMKEKEKEKYYIEGYPHS